MVFLWKELHRPHCLYTNMFKVFISGRGTLSNIIFSQHLEAPYKCKSDGKKLPAEIFNSYQWTKKKWSLLTLIVTDEVHENAIIKRLLDWKNIPLVGGGGIHRNIPSSSGNIQIMWNCTNMLIPLLKWIYFPPPLGKYNKHVLCLLATFLCFVNSLLYLICTCLRYAFTYFLIRTHPNYFMAWTACW